MYIVRTPAEPLRPYLDRYWFVSCPPGQTFDLSVDVYVDGQPDLVMNHGAPYCRIDADGSEHRVTYSSIDAQRTKPVKILQQGDVQVCGARFTVAGLSAFTRVPMRELTDRIVPVTDVFGTAAVALEETLSELRPDADAMSRVLDGFFIERLARSSALEHFCACARAIDERLPDEVPISAIASDVGISLRTLQRAFDRAVGLTPTFYVRIARFQRALRLIMDNKTADLGQVAQDAGYYDQPHLIREFHALAGGIPKRYRGYLPEEGRDFAPNVVTYRQ